MSTNICPGCGRCRDCGQPSPATPEPVYPGPYPLIPAPFWVYPPLPQPTWIVSDWPPWLTVTCTDTTGTN